MRNDKLLQVNIDYANFLTRNIEFREIYQVSQRFEQAVNA